MTSLVGRSWEENECAGLALLLLETFPRDETLGKQNHKVSVVSTKQMMERNPLAKTLAINAGHCCD
jgi:hypothetical protein